MAELLSAEQVEAALKDKLPAWKREGDEIVRAVKADTFAGGIRLVDQVAVVADEMDHHPDIDIRWTKITFRLSTHSAGGLTENDLNLAAKIDQIVG
jgi:4a-hydroxytetrahydrobiopterin dehydratase